MMAAFVDYLFEKHKELMALCQVRISPNLHNCRLFHQNAGKMDGYHDLSF